MTASPFQAFIGFVTPLRLTDIIHASWQMRETNGDSFVGQNEEYAWERTVRMDYRFNTMSRATLPLGPNGF